jgi:hypothetical protein
MRGATVFAFAITTGQGLFPDGTDRKRNKSRFPLKVGLRQLRLQAGLANGD